MGSLRKIENTEFINLVVSYASVIDKQAAALVNSQSMQIDNVGFAQTLRINLFQESMSKALSDAK